MTYAYEQVLTYEIARDLLNSYIADCSAAIEDEKQKPKSSKERLDKLRQTSLAIAIERDDMAMMDDAAMAAILKKYRRPLAPAAA